MNKNRPYNYSDKDAAAIKRAFLFHVHPEPNTGCFFWAGPRLMKRGNYGVFTMRRAGYVMARAHRVAWEIENGKLPPDVHVLHRCDNPICVNTDHLFLGDQAANMRDKALKGRQRAGFLHPKVTHGRYIGQKQNPEYHQ